MIGSLAEQVPTSAFTLPIIFAHAAASWSINTLLASGATVIEPARQTARAAAYAVAKPALRHRIELRPEVELEGVTTDGVLDGILASVPVPR